MDLVPIWDSDSDPESTTAEQHEDSADPALSGITVNKEDDWAKWYDQVLIQGDMISHYDISGCYVLKPWSWFMWKQIQAFLDSRFQAMGVEDCNFPLLISRDTLERVKDHYEYFAPETLWATHGGSCKLEKAIAVRPTSESAVSAYLAKEIRSHRDLPLRLNQWGNSVRWEFKFPIPFIRGRDFQWQEGHTAHLTENEAASDAHKILDHYADVHEQLLAIPVIKGRKSSRARFDGADDTLTIVAFIPASGRGIHVGSSHCLGQQFSKRFDIVAQDTSVADSVQQPPVHVWQTSWRLSERAIGVMVLTHGDSKGLVLPPRVAKIQVVIIPTASTTTTLQKDRQRVHVDIIEFEQVLKRSGVRAMADLRDDHPADWKFDDWELKGVPLRLEYGLDEAVASVVTVVRRDTKVRTRIPAVNIASQVVALLQTIQQDLLTKAEQEFSRRRRFVESMDALIPTLQANMACLIPHCLLEECEDTLRDLSRASSPLPEHLSTPAKCLCVPFDQPSELAGGHMDCLNPQCQQKARKWVLFGRSY